jgi:hypothetical protein
VPGRPPTAVPARRGAFALTVLLTAVPLGACSSDSGRHHLAIGTATLPASLVPTATPAKTPLLPAAVDLCRLLSPLEVAAVTHRTVTAEGDLTTCSWRVATAGHAPAPFLTITTLPVTDRSATAVPGGTEQPRLGHSAVVSAQQAVVLPDPDSGEFLKLANVGSGTPTTRAQLVRLTGVAVRHYLGS